MTQTLKVENKNKRRPYKPKAWSHHDELKAMIGKQIVIVSSGVETEAKLLETDSFTIKVQIPHPRTATVITPIISKHSISTIWAV